MLIGVIGPPRSEPMTGPELDVSIIHEARAVARSSCRGIVRPLFFFAAQSRSSIAEETWPLGSSTISQVSLAISPARKPAFTDKRTMTRLRSGVSGCASVGEELAQLLVVENFCLPACHLNLDGESSESGAIGRQHENEGQKRKSFAPSSHSTHEQIIIFSSVRLNGCVKCLLSGVKRTLVCALQMSASDPKRT